MAGSPEDIAGCHGKPGGSVVRWSPKGRMSVRLRFLDGLAWAPDGDTRTGGLHGEESRF